MSNARKVLPAAVLVALALAVAPVAEAQPPIRIGVSRSQTGSYTAVSQEMLHGYQLCVRHTNDKGGVLGRRLELIVGDDQSQPATAARISRGPPISQRSWPRSGRRTPTPSAPLLISMTWPSSAR